MKLIDLTGQKFNRLLVIKRDLSRKGVYWICQCDCGNQVSVLSQNLRTGNTQSCGCLNREKLDSINTIDLTGKTFGDLIVLERDYSKKGNRTYWKCQCRCGEKIIVSGTHLRNGHTKSCGCLVNKTASEIHLKDLQGKIVGNLEVLRRDVSKTEKRVYWICKCSCGNEVSVRSDHLLKEEILSCGCLSISKGEKKIEEILKKLNLNFKKQFTFENLKGYSRALKFDFVIFKEDSSLIAIEYQGEQHYKEIDFFGGKENFIKQKEYDLKKKEYCHDNNIMLLEIPYWDYNRLNEEYLINLINQNCRYGGI